MKKILLIALISIVASSVYAQKGLEIGLRGMPQNTWLLNEADFGEGEELNYELTWGSAYGLMVGYNFSDKMGLRVNALMSSEGQKFVGNFSMPQNIDSTAYSSLAAGQKFLYGDTSITYTAQVKLDYIKVPLLLKFNSNPTSGGAFFTFEVGPQINLLRSAKHTIDGKTVDYSIVDFNTKDLYNETVIAVAFGLGADINLSEKLKLNANFRFDYGITDTENKDFAISGSKLWEPARPATHSATGGLMLGLTYVIGGGE